MINPSPSSPPSRDPFPHSAFHITGLMSVSSYHHSMKPNLLPCLALILSGGLFGCSTVPRGALHDSEGKLFTDQQAVAFKTDASSRPWRLKYAVTQGAGDGNEFFATVHQLHDMYAASIYARLGDRLRLLKRLTAGTDGDDRNSSFLEPNFFWTTPKNDSWQKLI